MLGYLQEDDASSLTADNLEKFGKLSAHPGPPDDGTLLSEAKLQSIMSFLDEMEKSGQERPAPRREVVSPQVPEWPPVGTDHSQGPHTASIPLLSSEEAKADRAASSYPGLISRQVILSRWVGLTSLGSSDLS